MSADAPKWDGPATGPMVEGRPHTVKFGEVGDENRGDDPINPPLEREDKFFWLRSDSRDDKQVIAHLKREREYLDFKTAGIKGAAQALYDEHVARLNETDVGCPTRDGEWEYYRRTIKGLSYGVFCRRPRGASRLVTIPSVERGAEAGEQEILDVNKLADGKTQCDVSSVETSPSQKLLAFTVDFTGNEVYDLHIRETAAGGHSEAIEKLEGLPLDGSIEFGLDDTTLYYTTRDEALRSFRVYRHVLGTPATEDELILEEDDEVWSIGCGKTLEGNHLAIGCGGHDRQPRAAQCADTGLDRAFPGDGQMEHAARRRTDALAVVGVHRIAEQHHRIRTGGIGDADDSSGIARLGYLYRNGHQPRAIGQGSIE